MKFTLSWLKEYLDTNATLDEICEGLIGVGLEVEEVTDKTKLLADFTVAHVRLAEKHPNADKLRQCVVETKDGTKQVVCGAPNARTGIKAIIALPGVTIPATGTVFAPATIRGVESQAMLCSERELLISDEHNGIIEVEGDWPVGTPAATALGLDDPMIYVKVTPNRPDALGIYGIARDLAAKGLGTLKPLDAKKVEGSFDSPIKVSLDFPDGDTKPCPLFVGRYIRGVKNGPSPEWLQRQLRAIGLRPISKLVDVTNYITFAYGRPLHVFDADKVKGNVRARLARDGETLEALDNKTYTLSSDMTVIADDAGPEAIAGIIGGIPSSCTDETVNVFLESAWFDPLRTAATGRKLGITSDARYRFERGVDPEFVLPGLELATKLILQFCGGEPSDAVVAGDPPQWKRTIPFSAAEVKRLAGLEISPEEIQRILTSLGFGVSGADTMTVMPPSWRPDVHGPADLVEEVVRIHGIENVQPVAMLRPYAVAQAVLTPAQRRMSTVRRTLATRGFDETVHFSFIPRAHASLFGGGDEGRQLENPISADLDALRPSLLPSLLAAAQRNQARGFLHAMLFEIAPQFASGVPGAQANVAAGVRIGEPPRHWMKNGNVPGVFTAKADALAALEGAWGGPMTAPVQAGAAAWYHPGRSGTIAMGPKPLAFFGELHPRIAAAFDLKGPVSVFEIFLDAIPEPKTKPTKARGKLESSDLMAVERDFAFLLDTSVAADAVVKAARSVDRQLIETVSVFDLYEGKGVPEGKKSLAIAVRLQPKDRTLTEAEIDATAQKIVTAVTKATGGILRS